MENNGDGKNRHCVWCKEVICIPNILEVCSPWGLQTVLQTARPFMIFWGRRLWMKILKSHLLLDPELTNKDPFNKTSSYDVIYLYCCYGQQDKQLRKETKTKLLFRCYLWYLEFLGKLTSNKILLSTKYQNRYLKMQTSYTSIHKKQLHKEFVRNTVHLKTLKFIRVVFWS